MTGRDSDDTSGYLPSYRALALIALTTNRDAYSSRASTTRASIAPATSAPLTDGLPVRGVGVRLLADVDRERDDLRAPLLLDPLHRDGRVETARVREHHPLCHVVLLSALQTREPGQATGDRRAPGRLRADQR